MNRGSVVLFVFIIGIAVVIVAAGLLAQSGALTGPTPTPEPTRAVLGRPTVTPEPTRPPVVATPLYAPDVDPNDGLPTYTCGADAFGSYFTLQQMVMAGIDVENGFHLAIVPFELDETYSISEEDRTAAILTGQWDCLLTTMDSVALTGAGMITAIVDESAGADQLWVREIETINDLSGKRIAFSEGSVGEFFMQFTLSVARLNPRTGVTLVPAASVSEAIELFNNGQADAVSGWEPDIYDAEASGGVPLLSSEQLRVIIDVVVTSRQSITDQPELVQAFHDAWFQTLRAQFEDFDTAAAQIAAWGNNDWSFVYTDTASDDLNAWLGTIAQATLEDNAQVMRDPFALYQRLETARRVWAAAGQTVPEDEVSTLVEPRFVLEADNSPNLATTASPVNDSFSLGSNPDLSALAPNQGQTLGILPCNRFSFLPESTELTLQSRDILNDCVIPIMSSSVGIYLRVTGSSAWPASGPGAPYSEEEIYQFGLERAQSVVDYLVGQGIDEARFSIDATLPPEERRNTDDPQLQEMDRFVQMTLITVGR